MSGTLILGDWLITSPVDPPQPNRGIRVTNDSIAAIGPNDELRRAYPEEEIHEAPGCVIAPGFVNAHTHLYGTLAHGIPLARAPSDFWSFLADFWWPLVEDALDHEMVTAATDWVCAEMLRSGVTSFYDCLEGPYAIPDALLAQKEVVEARGMRAILSFEATERVSSENGQQGLQENAAFRRAGPGVNVLSYHFHLLSRLYPPGLCAGGGAGGADPHALQRRGARAQVCPGTFWQADSGILRGVRRDRATDAGLSVRPAL